MCTRKITGSVLHGRLFRFQYENTYNDECCDVGRSVVNKSSINEFQIPTY